jgi:hypothetical protein
MSDGMVRRWSRIFTEGRMNVHNDDRSGCPSLVTPDLLDQVNEKMQENIRFTVWAEYTFPTLFLSSSMIHQR